MNLARNVRPSGGRNASLRPDKRKILEGFNGPLRARVTDFKDFAGNATNFGACPRACVCPRITSVERTFLNPHDAVGARLNECPLLAKPFRPRNVGFGR